MASQLKNGVHRSYSSTRDSDDDFLKDAGWEVSSRAKKWLVTLGTLVAVCLLYVFCYLLPKMFIPETRDLVGIQKVQLLDFFLVPVLSDNASLWELESTEFETEITDFEELRKSSRLNKSRERLILIGDIHGQYRELKKLLRKVKYNDKRDQLVVLGDFISKGPHSIKVLEYLIDHNVGCIIGNHEYYVLQNYAQYHGIPQPFFVNGTSNPNFSIFKKFNDDPEFLLAKKLRPRHIDYINNCPVMKELGQVPLHSKKNQGKGGHADGIAVHAGLRWDALTDLNEQDPVDCLEMRSYLAPFFNETTDDPGDKNAVSWSKIWNKKQKEGELDRSLVVYYGHDAGRGLNLRKYSKGLDSGCYKGDKLSAMVIWQEKKKNKVFYKEALVQQKC